MANSYVPLLKPHERVDLISFVAGELGVSDTERIVQALEGDPERLAVLVDRWRERDEAHKGCTPGYGATRIASLASVQADAT